MGYENDKSLLIGPGNVLEACFGVFPEHENAEPYSHALHLAPHTLLTAEIIYCLPDHPLLLQTYIWQDYDKAPEFPVLSKFLKFWEREIEGPLHSVTLCHSEMKRPVEFSFYSKEYTLH